MNFKTEMLNFFIETLKDNSKALALWEAGSAANNTSDEFSDIDLLILTDSSNEKLFEEIEAKLTNKFKIIHKYVEVKPLQEGQFHRIYFFEGSPKHFFLDLGILSKNAENCLNEILQKERHGTPIVHFDKTGLIKAKSVDTESLNVKQKQRLEELEASFPVYFTTVMKELDREHPIDSFHFYYAGMLRPLVEVLGMLHRSSRYDFGLRYLHKDFPSELQETIKSFLYPIDEKSLKESAIKTEKLFRETLIQLKAKL